MHPQAGFSLTLSSGLLALEKELGSLYEHTIVEFSSEIGGFFKKATVLCAVYA